MSALFTLIVRRRFWFVLMIGLCTVLLGTQVRHLKIVIDPSAMLPKAHPNVIGTNIAEALFGSKYVVVVGVSRNDGKSALEMSTLQTVADLSKEIVKIPGVKAHTLLSATADKARAISGADGQMTVEPLLDVPITQSGIEAMKKRLHGNPIFQNTVISADESLASISFSIDVGPKGFREVMDKVQNVLAKAATPEIKITSSGTAVFFANVERFSQRMVFLFPIALVIIGLIHLEAFRSVQGLLLPLVTAILAVVWSLGIMGLAKVSMDAFNATTPILILAVAAGHAVQILKRYYEEYEKLHTEHPNDPLYAINDRAIVDSLKKIAPVMIAAGLVAALGFFSLLTFQIATIRTFGLFTGLGILSALLIELTFIPALRSYLPPPKVADQTPAPTKPRLWDAFAARLTHLVTQRQHAVIMTFAVLGLIACAAMSFINRENSTKSYFGENLPVRQEDRFLNDKLAGTNTLYVVFQGARPDQMKDPAMLAVIDDAQRYIGTLEQVGKTVSIVDLIKQMNRAMVGTKNAQGDIAASQNLVSQYLLLYSMSGQPTDFDAYIDYAYQNANLIVWLKNDSSKYAETIVKQIRTYITPKLPAGVTLQIGGSVPQTSALSETLVDGKIQNILQMMVFVFFAGIIVFRSFLAGVYLVLPLIFTVLVNFGIMGLTGIPLNTPNSVSSAMAIGIGADYAIYLLYRIREELQAGITVDDAIARAMRTAGKAVVYVASAISGGYAVLMLSFGFYVHIWFGLLIVMSMIVSATSALVLIPSLIKWHTPKFLQKKPSVGAPMHIVTAAITGFCVVVLLPLAQPVVAQELSADAIMEKNYLVTRLDSSLSEASFRLVSATGQERIRKTFGVTKLQSDGMSNRRVIRFLAPSDVRNTTTLLVENAGKADEIWIYLPALKKARRLSSNNKRNSFVGTDLSYGDLVGHKSTDWQHTIVRQEQLSGIATVVIESVPKNSEIANDSGYSKRVSWVAKANFFSLKVDYFDASGNHLKTLENSELKQVDAKQNKIQAMQIQVKNHQTGHSTFVRMDRFEANLPLKEDFFTVSYLEKEE